MRAWRWCRAALLVAVVVVAGLGVVGTASAADTTAPDCSSVTFDGSGTEGNPWKVSNVDELQCVGENHDSADTQSDALSGHYTLMSDIDASGTDEWNDGDGFDPIGDLDTGFTGTFDGTDAVIVNLSIDPIDSEDSQIGLFGRTGSGATIENVALENVTVSGESSVGGLVGKNLGTVKLSYAAGTISGSGNGVGGLVGENDGKLIRSNATGTATGSGSGANIGGLVGRNKGTVRESYATGEAFGTNNVGGLVGSNDPGTITQSYATATVSGKENLDRRSGDQNVGGLVGDGTSGTVKNSYATGTVSGYVDTGGLFGYTNNNAEDSYWNTETTGQDASGGGGTGLTTTEMLGSNAKSNMDALDFSSTWETVENSDADTTGDGYPVLRSLDRQAQLKAQDVNPYAGGDGTEGSPYEIADWRHLDNVRENLTANFTLVNDLNQSTAGYDGVAGPSANGETGFDPIGDSTTPFTGVFDGTDAVIANLSIDRNPDIKDGVGLFGNTKSDVTIKRVRLEDVDVNGSSSNRVGAIVGEHGADDDKAATVTKSYATGTVVTDGRNVGGLVGLNYGTVKQSYATVDVEGGEEGEEKDLGAGPRSGIGGIVGRHNSGTITESYATGSVSGKDGATNIQGVGGLAGVMEGGTTVEQSYATGNVGGDSDVGGLVGFSDGRVNDSYWDKTTTTQGAAIGNNDGDASGLKGFGSTTEMLGSSATSTMDALDFSGTWETVENSDADTTGDGYPVLRSLDRQAQLKAQDVNPYAGGEGTEGSPYEIADWRHLDNVRQNLDANFRLVSDLNESTAGYDAVARPSANGGNGFDPIGDATTTFDGTFNGTGAVIANLSIDREGSQVGLFGKTGFGSVVENVTLEDVDVSGGNVFGGLAGENDGTVKNVSVTGNVSGGETSSAVAGLVGRNEGDGTVTNSSATGNVSGGSRVGGLVGKNSDGTVSDSSATSDITGTGSDVGGLVGDNDGTVSDSYATGDVSGPGPSIGGLVGINQKIVTRSYATGDVSGIGDSSEDIGGLVGSNDDKVTRSYATGTVSGNTGAGGLVGDNDGTVTDGYWDTETTSQDSSAGGTGLTTTQLKGNESLADFDFENTWAVVNETRNGLPTVSYPYLRTNTQSPAPGLEGLYAGGDGTESDPYEIADWRHLDNARENLTANFTLVNDLNESTAGYDAVANGSANGGNGFEPIGDATEFNGTFDGTGAVIANLSIDPSDSEDSQIGLFGRTGSEATIENVALEDIDVSGDLDVGGLVGENVDGTVENSSMSGNISGSVQTIGGLIGYNDGGTVANSSSSGNISGPNNVGGLIGKNDGNGTVNRSHATGTVNGTGSGGPVGGLVGYNDGNGTVNRSYATGNVSTSGPLVGGLVGDNRGTVNTGYATGNVSGKDDVGGLVGINFEGTVKESYATGNVSGTDNVGGLVGLNRRGTVKRSYATGNVSGDGFGVGGLVGDNGGTVTDAYWNIETTGQSSSAGSGTRLTTSQLKGNESLSGFDFETTWDVTDTASQASYPYLQANAQQPAPGLDSYPTAADDSYTVTEGETLSIAAPGVLSDDTDPDGDALSAVRETGPADGDLALDGDGSFTYTPDSGFSGTDSFTYEASVGGLTDTATVTITVEADDSGGGGDPIDFNTPPRAEEDSYAVGENGTLSIAADEGVLANDRDPDGSEQLLTAWTVTEPAQGRLTLARNGSFVYAAGENASGTDTFTYRVSDRDGGFDTAQVTITIRDPSGYAVGLAEPNLSVRPDGTVSVAATVTNRDTVSGTETAAFRIDADGNGTLEADETRANESIPLAPGGNATVTFGNVSTAGLSAGTYTHGVVVGNASATGTLTVERSGQVSIGNVSLAPNTVPANTSVDHTLTVGVQNVSDDGSTDGFTLTVPEAVDLRRVNGVTVTDAGGIEVPVDSLNRSGGTITFDVAPNSSATTRTLTVETNLTVSVPAVTNGTTADVTVAVSDSSTGQDSANATLTIQSGSAHDDLTPERRVLRTAGVDDPADLEQTDIANVVTLFNREETRNGVAVTQDDVSNTITLYIRNN
jgi:hypothetical protein